MYSLRLECRRLEQSYDNEIGDIGVVRPDAKNVNNNRTAFASE